MASRTVRIRTRNTMPKACVITVITCTAARTKPTNVSTQIGKSMLVGFVISVTTTSYTKSRSFRKTRSKFLVQLSWIRSTSFKSQTHWNKPKLSNKSRRAVLEFQMPQRMDLIRYSKQCSLRILMSNRTLKWNDQIFIKTR